MLTRQAIIDAAKEHDMTACRKGLAAFDAINGGEPYEWNEDAVRRVYSRYPQFLKFLEQLKVVPTLVVSGVPDDPKLRYRRIHSVNT